MTGARYFGQRGMISILALAALGILLFLTGTLYAVGKERVTAAHRFLGRNALRDTADSGVRFAVSRLNSDPEAASRAESYVFREKLLLSGTMGESTFDVYVRKKDGNLLLLSVGKKGEDMARAVGAVVKVDGKYRIEHWER